MSLTLDESRYFENATQFSLHIEELAKKLDMNHLQALVHFCEETGAEYEAAAALVSPSLKEKIRLVAGEFYAMPKFTTVTLDDDA